MSTICLLLEILFLDDRPSFTSCLFSKRFRILKDIASPKRIHFTNLF